MLASPLYVLGLNEFETAGFMYLIQSYWKRCLLFRFMCYFMVKLTVLYRDRLWGDKAQKIELNLQLHLINIKVSVVCFQWLSHEPWRLSSILEWQTAEHKLLIYLWMGHQAPGVVKESNMGFASLQITFFTVNITTALQHKSAKELGTVNSGTGSQIKTLDSVGGESLPKCERSQWLNPYSMQVGQAKLLNNWITLLQQQFLKYWRNIQMYIIYVPYFYFFWTSSVSSWVLWWLTLSLLHSLQKGCDKKFTL